MSNIDKQALREAAEKATSGKWERGDGNGNGGELLVYCDDALGSAVCEMTSEYNAIPKYQRINNLNFIAAANPATVLALLDELEPMALAHLNLNLLCDVYRSAYEEARHDGLVNWEAASSLAEENEDLKRKLEAAEKRIAGQLGIIASARKFISEYAGLGDVGAAEFIKIIDRAAAGKGE